MRDFVQNFFAKRPAAKICCFHFGRCGSTLLGNMLGCHPKLHWASEIFHAHHERSNRSSSIDPYLMIRRLVSESEPLNFGFETKFQHLDPNGLNVDFNDYLQELRQIGFSHFFVLWRRNYLRQAISVARGQINGKWHVSSVDQKQPLDRLLLDTDAVSLGGFNRTLLDCFHFLDETYANTDRVFDQTGIEFLKLCYEDELCADPKIGYRLAVGHIGLKYAPPSVSVQKLESRPINEIVSNFDQIVRKLKNTKYEWMCYS